ncbi:MAG TPA: histidine kinase dimerization/phospho-acceptor domain-containing protein, partial [Polyangiaceae bacterium]|nr:histidine kinase dimerization/phospho-acceptor domain-containing protein [Polyangiaceae bacterium]
MLFVFLVLRVSLGLAGFALAYFMARARSFRPEHRLLAALGVLVGLESVWAIAESFGNHGPRFLNGEPWMTVVLVAVAATALGLFARRKRTFSFSTGSIDRDGTNGSEPEAEKGLSSVPRQTRHLDADWRDVVDCLPVGIVWIAGPSLQVQMWNRYEAQRTGIEARQVLGKRYLDQVAERHLDGRLVEAIRAKPQEIVTFPSVSWSVQGESGIETTIVPFRSEHEQEGYLIVTFDTTERDAYFREREEVRKQAALREFASAIAHDIRTPLSSIRMSVQILRSKAVLSPEDMEYFDLTLEQISRLGTDIDELLVFTKPA